MRKLLWLVEIFLIFLVGGVLVQHAGRTGFASAGPDAIIQLALPQAFSVPCEAGRAPEAVAVEDPAGASL